MFERSSLWSVSSTLTLGTMDDSEKLKEVRQITQEWLDQQGHNRCWYYPELFAKLAATLELKISVDPALPSRPEFEEGCRRFQNEEFGT